MLKDFFELVGLALAAALAMAALFILTPLFSAAGGALTGWVLTVIFPFAGDWIVSGAGAVGIEITREQLPTIGALLGFIGAFFKATQTNKVEK